jgi:hypothetical protein
VGSRANPTMRWALIAFLCTGCVGWAVPPSRVTATGGLAAQALSEPDPVRGSATADAGMILRTEGDLLSAFDRAQSRPLDVGAGFMLLDLPETDALARYGPMISGRAHLITWREGDAVVRVSVGGNADVLFRYGGFGGAGGSATLDLEIAGWVHDSGAGGGADANGVGFGAYAAEGEGGIGIRAETSYHVLDDETHRWMFVLGLTVRIPAHVVGGIFIPTGWTT